MILAAIGIALIVEKEVECVCLSHEGKSCMRTAKAGAAAFKRFDQAVKFVQHDVRPSQAPWR